MNTYILRGHTKYYPLLSFVKQMGNIIPTAFGTIFLTLFYIDDKITYEILKHQNSYDFGENYEIEIENWINHLKPNTDLVSEITSIGGKYSMENFYFEVIIV